jgi:hypothetical protein
MATTNSPSISPRSENRRSSVTSWA